MKMVKTGDKAISDGIAEVIFDETDEDKCGGRSFVDVDLSSFDCLPAEEKNY
jgi:hypothetical protein